MRIFERTGRVIRSNREWRELAEAAQAEVEALRKTKHELAKALLATRTEADELRAALQRLADRRYDLCPTQIVHIVNTALRGEGE